MSYRIACIDLGGTMIKSGLWDGTALSHTQQTPTHAQEGAQAFAQAFLHGSCHRNAPFHAVK